MITPKITNLGYSNLWTDMSTILGYASNFQKLITKLFANGEQGFFYDPSDMGTMFQDAAGTIPVTATGKSVGLVLDKSKGLGLGGELNTGAWNLTSSWTITNGIATHAVGATGSCNLGGAVLGKWYKYRARVVNRSGSFLIACNSNIVININTPSDKIYDIYATSSVGGNGRLIDFYAQSNFDGDVYVSEVSVKEIRGNHAYQTTSSMRPLLVAAPQRLDYDTVDDKLITNLPTQLTGCTVVRSVPNIGTQILTNQTIPTPYNDNIDNCGLIVINRALTASETNQITKLFNKSAGV